jgi:zinc D-Ala-D-Ala carboxypeptidase
MKRSRGRRKQIQFWVLALLTAIVTVCIGASGFWIWQKGQPATITEKPSIQPPIASLTSTPTSSSTDAGVLSQISQAPTLQAETLAPPSPAVPLQADHQPLQQPFQQPVPKTASTHQQIPTAPLQEKYGHFSYGEAPIDRLVSLAPPYYERTESLIDTAAAAFAQMQADAAQAGVKLIPISGFRTVADQVKLFDRQIKRSGDEVNAARLSAPPGYSEHHTGYALDIGDGNQPDADLKYEFETTAAYQWLLTHATRDYGFELSFSENNRQGVSFEPWHWRFTASKEAAQIFAMART